MFPAKLRFCDTQPEVVPVVRSSSFPAGSSFAILSRRSCPAVRLARSISIPAGSGSAILSRRSCWLCSLFGRVCSRPVQFCDAQPVILPDASAWQFGAVGGAASAAPIGATGDWDAHDASHDAVPCVPAPPTFRLSCAALENGTACGTLTTPKSRAEVKAAPRRRLQAAVGAGAGCPTPGRFLSR